MSFKKNIVAFIIASCAAVSCIALPVSAEEDIVAVEEEILNSEDESSQEDGYITSGDYKYSVKAYDDGSQVAFLEEYLGDETKVEIPETIDDYTIKGLGDQTFYENEKIIEITISENLADFGYHPFYGCTSLMEFKVNEKNEIYEADSDGALVGKDGLAIMSYPTGKNPEKYTVADGIVGINSSAFAMCTNLKEITFPESIEFVGNFAFSECTSLETIVLPDNLSAIGNFTFSGCTSLKDITLPKNLQKIGNASFFKCESLEIIDFPTPLVEIGQAAFCSTGLTSITIPATISTIGYSAFGFSTDDDDELVLNENFVVMGYNGSYAQTYCQESDLTFVSIDESEDDDTINITGKDEKVVRTGLIAGICVVCAVIIIIVVVVIIKKKSNKDEDEDEDIDNGEEDSEENNDTEEK